MQGHVIMVRSCNHDKRVTSPFPPLFRNFGLTSLMRLANARISSDDDISRLEIILAKSTADLKMISCVSIA